MDRNRFDTLTRVVSARQSRRTALATLLGAALLGRDPGTALARGKRRGKLRAQATAGARPQDSASCYPGTRCTPGKGRNNSGCDFSGSTAFFERDVRGSNLSNANFTGADLRGANFKASNLSGACFVDVSLRGATLDGSVNLHKAIFCRAIMPDGSRDDSGCDQGSLCCPTCTDDDSCAEGETCCGGWCIPAECPPTGATCRRADDCMPRPCFNHYCFNGTCQWDYWGNGVRDRRCPAQNPVCSFGRCGCLSSADCQDGRVCCISRGQPPFGVCLPNCPTA
jgi:hypothetical protein